MKADPMHRAAFYIYLGLFILLLLAPLAVMALSAFNAPTYPQAWPIEGLTLAWFRKLATSSDLLDGLRNSVVIAVAVTALSVPIGLAAAIVMN